MKIVKLTLTGTEKVVAQAYSTNKKDKLYFNIKHGSSGDKLGYWLGRISPKIAIPNNISEVYELNNDNYILTPARNAGEIIKDKLNNNIYSIGIDFNTLHKKDILLFWEIPNKNYSNVEYSIYGDVSEIGIAYNGRDRGDVLYKSPAPILEIYGDCKLCWKAIDKNYNVLEQHVSYNYEKGTWDIPPATITKANGDIDN